MTCILREISTKLLGMPTHLDWSSLAAAGLYLMRLVTQMSGVDSPLLLSVACRQQPFLSSFFQLPLVFPCLLPVTSRSRAQAFIWFRAKTDKGIVCLADHPHSVTYDHTHTPLHTWTIDCLVLCYHILFCCSIVHSLLANKACNIVSQFRCHFVTLMISVSFLFSMCRGLISRDMKEYLKWKIYLHHFGS